MSTPVQPVQAAASGNNRVTTYLNQQLEKTRQQVKTNDIFSAGLKIVVASMALLIVAAVWDGWVAPLSTTGRWICLLMLVVTAAAIVAWEIVPLFFRRINPEFAARMIETAQPGFKNSLLNYVLLRKQPEQVSPAIMQAISRRAATDLTAVPSDATIDRSKIIRLGMMLVALTLFIVVYKVLSPKDPLQSFARILMPTAKLAQPARVQITDITPGDVDVYFGDRVEISATIRGLNPQEEAFLLVSSRDGQIINQRFPLAEASGSNRFQGWLGDSGSGVQQSLDYQVIAADGVSATYQVNVQSLPTIAVESVTLTPPQYTRLPARQYEGRGSIDAVEGTRISIDAIANLPIKEAYLDLMFAGEETGTATLGGAAGGNGSGRSRTVQTLNMQVDGNKAHTTFYALLDAARQRPMATHYRLRFVSLDNATNRKPNVYPIQITPDLAPEIRVLQPLEEESSIPEDGSLWIEVEANDLDYEISAIKLTVNRQGVQIRQQGLELQSLSEGQPNGQRNQKVKARHALSPRELGLKQGDVATFFLTAADNRTTPSAEDIPDPNISRSDNYTLIVTEPSQHEQNEAEQPAADDPKSDDPTKQDPSDPQQQQQQQQGDQERQQQGDQESQQDQRSDDDQSSQQQSGGQQQNQGQQDDSQQQSGQQQQGTSGQSEQQDQQDDQQSGQQQGDGQAGSDGQGSSEQQQSADGQSTSGSQQTGQQQSNQQQSQSDQSNSSQSTQPQAQQNDATGRGDQNQSNPADQSQSNSADATDSQQGQGTGSPDNSAERQPLNKDATVQEQLNRLQELLDQQNEQDAANDADQSSADSESDQSTGEQSTGEQSTGDQQTGEQSTDDQQTGEQSTDDQQTGEQSTGDQSSGETQQRQGDDQQKQEGQTKDSQQQTGDATDDQQQGNQSQQGSGQEQQADNQEKQQGQEKQGSGQDQKETEKGQQESGQDQKQGSQDKQGTEQGGQEADQNKQQGGQEEQAAGGQEGQQDQQQSSGDQQSTGDQQSSESEQQGGQSENQAGSDQTGSDTSEQSDSQSQEQGAESGQDTGQQQQTAGDDSSQSDGEGSPTGTGNQTTQQQSGQQSPEEGKQPNQQSTSNMGSGAGSGESFAREREDVNLEHSRKSTDMILKRLEDQQYDPDPKLLEQMNWNADDLNNFVQRWQEMKRAAQSGDAAAKRRYEQTLKSLNFRAGTDLRRVRQSEVDASGLNQDSTVIRPPPRFAPDFQATLRDLNRSED